MRPIDADRLKEAIVEEGQRSKRYKIGEFWELNRDEIWKAIDEQPTVQPERERGHWIEGRHRKFIDLANADRQYTELGYPHRTYINMSCSNCGMITIVDASIRYDFCPHCGADMKEV